MDAKAALIDALTGIGVSAGDVKGFLFEDGFSAGARARLDDDAYTQVRDHEGELAQGLFEQGWAMTVYRPRQLVLICEL